MSDAVSGGSNYRFNQRFEGAHRKAARQDFIARLSGKQNDLLPFDAVAQVLQTYQQIPRPDPQVVPLNRIVGSVGRYSDFTRDIMPRNAALAERWIHVDREMDGLEGLPPIDLLKVGEVYFVVDGNHRVSVAAANGFSDIEAYITEIPIDVDLNPGDTLEVAIEKAGRARFLDQTGLDKQVPHPDIYFTKAGGYTRLLQHIEVHRRLMARNDPAGGGVVLQDAAIDWYENSYLPVVAAIRDRGLLSRFPNRTASDLYVWVWDAMLEMYRVFGEKVGADEGAALLELRAGSPFRQALQELMAKINVVAQAFTGGANDMPEWADGSFEWDDAAGPLPDEDSQA